MRRKLVGIAGIAALAAVTGLGLEAQPRSSSGQWRSVGGDPAFTRYSPLDQINKNNVKTLKIAWRQAGYDPALKTAFPELRVSGNYRSTPIMVDGVLYAPNAVGLVRAFGPGSGEIRWEQAPFAQTIEEVSRPSPRGVDYWKGGSEQRLFTVPASISMRIERQRRVEHSRTSATGGRVRPALERIRWPASSAGPPARSSSATWSSSPAPPPAPATAA